MPTPHRVLYVNDNPADSEPVWKALGDPPGSIDLVEVRTRAEFEAFLLQSEFSAVLVNMPVYDFDGTEVVDRIHTALPTTPILLLAGVETEWTALEAMKCGAAGYVLKQRAHLERLGHYLYATIDKGRLVEMKNQAERELEHSQTFCRSILDALTEHIAVVDQNGLILTVNRAWNRFAEENGPIDLLEVGPGTSYLDVCAKAEQRGDRQARMAREGIQGVLEGSYESFSMEYPCHSPDQQRWFMLSVTPIALDLPGAVVSHTDITDRRIAEETLYQTRVQLDFALRALSIGYWEWDLESDEVYFSPEWKLQLGYDEYDVPNLRQSWEDLLHPDDHDSAVHTIAAWTRQSHRGPLSTEYRLLHKDGTYRKILCKASIQKESSGRLLRMIGVHVDVTPKEPEE